MSVAKTPNAPFMTRYQQFYRSIDKAIMDEKLSEPFSAYDVEQCCDGFSVGECRTYLSKYARGNSGGRLELFERLAPGQYTRLRFYVKRDAYIDLFEPLFLPDDPVSNDIIKYFAAILRVVGMEDKGWDPHAESRKMLNDLNGFLKVEMPRQLFPEPDGTQWRLGLLLYTQIVEMDAPYEVLLNLLRFRLGDGYSPNPYFDYLSEPEKKSYRKRGIATGRKIQIIKRLSDKAGLDVGSVFDDFYDNRLRNAISHSDYILTEEGFRCRGGTSVTRAFHISFEELDQILTAAKAFIAAFFSIDHTARGFWGGLAGRAVPYDERYKGMMEVLSDNAGLMCGFKVHWPNGTDSTYRRTENGVEMVNCAVAMQRGTLDLMVGSYASEPGSFSPLVAKDGKPVYSPREGNKRALLWPGDGLKQ
ncbi:hypothetical protein [Roseovarius sp.]|uniref:hypothetical protein n=1 Tax=Roseovarius sp. TaxID=1486281 RepID=UPI003B5C590D